MARRKIPPLEERNASNNYGLEKPYIDERRSKNGKYVAYFTYWKPDGKIGNNNTASFAKKSQALKVAQEKQKESLLLLRDNVKAESSMRSSKAELTIEQCLDEYIAYLETMKGVRSQDQKSVNRSNWDLARQLKSKHMDPDIQYKKLKDIEDEDFAEWISYINNQPNPANKTSGLYAGETVNGMKKILKKFILYLQGNRYCFFDKDLPDRLLEKLKNRKIRKKESGSREDLLVPTYEQVKQLVSIYDRTTFFGEYCYCLFMFMFFSGCRISEVINIQIKDIDWENGEIHIKNSAHQREDRKQVMDDLKNENYKVKSKNAERYIPMMDCYYGMLKTYFERYKQEFSPFSYGEGFKMYFFPDTAKKIKEEKPHLSDEVYYADAFLFPKLQTRYDNKDEKGMHVYQTAKWVNAELKRACKAIGMNEDEHYCCLSFRHAAARFFAYDLKLLEGEAVDLFGHGDDGTILRNIYAKLEAKDKCDRLKRRHTNLFYRNPEAEKRRQEEADERIKNLVKGDALKNKQEEIELENMQKMIERHIAEGHAIMSYNINKREIIKKLEKQYHYSEKILLIPIE